MGRRVLTVAELTFHQKRKPKERTYAPSDLNDEDLLDIFHAWVVGLAPADTHNKDRQTWVSVAGSSGPLTSPPASVAHRRSRTRGFHHAVYF